MRHRGPDGSGIATFPGGAVGMVRLALLDLTARGQQPMWSPDGQVGIVFNGEMYDHAAQRRWLEGRGHSFRTTTDTEVVLALYLELGLQLFDRLRGMYAFAIVDRRGRSADQPPALLLARDPFGIKPLFVAQTPNGGIVFASEIRGLLASGLVAPTLDRDAVRSFLSHGFVLPPRTILRDVRAVAPGTWERYVPEGPKDVHTFWRLPPYEPVKESFEEAAERLRSTLEESVRLHALADAEVGAFLSGGLDSAALVALMRPHVRRLRTYTLRFPDQPGFGEADVAGETARRLGCEHIPVDITDAEIARVLPTFVGDLGQPSTDGLNSWLVSRAAAGGVRAALSGLGGDEWFLGYELSAMMAKRPPPALRTVASLAARLEPRIGGRRWRDRAWNLGSRRSPVATWSRMHSVFSAAEAGEMTGLPASSRAQEAELMARVAEWSSGAGSDTPAGLAQLLDARVYMGSQLLPDTDATSMAHSLEVRTPLVDIEVVRFARSCSDAYKRDAQGGKRVLARAVADVVPAAVLARPKQGFALPHPAWMRGVLAPLVEETCHPEVVHQRGLIDPDRARPLYDAWRAGEQSEPYPRLWSFLVLELWCRSLDAATAARVAR